MGSARSRGRGRVWICLPLFLSGAACHLAPAKVWNLEQVHSPDGAPSRRGDLHSDFGYVLSRLMKSTNFGGAPPEQAPVEKRIDDPLGTCLENLVELGQCARDEKVAAIQAAAFAWLAVDCTYVLSRERSVLELGELAQVLDLPSAPAPPEGEAATPEEVRALFDELLAVTREVSAAPDLAGTSLTDLCARIDATGLDRPGALRLLRGTVALLEGRESGAVFAPLRALRLHLARRCTALALREAREDPQGLVRAAALESGLRAFPQERSALLRWAFGRFHEGVENPIEITLRAIEFLARYGLPEPGEGESQEELDDYWRNTLVQVLRLQINGSHAIAACHALAKISGEPATLHPEIWIERWRASSAATAPPAADDAGPGSTP